MSSDLQWQVVRNAHAYLIKKDGYVFSAEPGNLMNQHSFKFNGFIHRKTIDVSANKDKKLAITVKKTPVHLARRPATNSVVVPLNRHRRGGKILAARTIKKLTKNSYYRADLTKFAIGRYHALKKSVTLPESAYVNKVHRRSSKRPSSAATSE